MEATARVWALAMLIAATGLVSLAPTASADDTLATVFRGLLSACAAGFDGDAADLEGDLRADFEDICTSIFGKDKVYLCGDVRLDVWVPSPQPRTTLA